MHKTYNRPTKFDFIPHYKGDGLKPITFRIRVEGEPLDLENSSIRMQLRHPKLTEYTMNLVLNWMGRGRGSIQLTFKDNYKRMERLLNIHCLVEHPDLVAENEW